MIIATFYVGFNFYHKKKIRNGVLGILDLESRKIGTSILYYFHRQALPKNRSLLRNEGQGL